MKNMKLYAFLADGFETVEALGVIDILRRGKVPPYRGRFEKLHEYCHHQVTMNRHGKYLCRLSTGNRILFLLPYKLPPE